MAFGLGSSLGASFVSSVVSEQVYDPVFDTPIDSNFIYQLLPSFYKDLMDDQDIFGVTWSGLLQQAAADLLNLWQVDYAKSLRDVPVFAQRKWVSLDFVREVPFTDEPDLAFRASGNHFFVFDDAADVLHGVYVSRSRSDGAGFGLTRVVNDRASLSFSLKFKVLSGDKFSSALWGYTGGVPLGPLRSFFGAALLNSETVADAPRPALLYVDQSGVPTVSISSFTLTVGASYQMDFNYTSGTTVAVLEVRELQYPKQAGTSGETLGEQGEVLTNFFQDSTVNFDALGVVAGDTLIVLGAEYEILSVDGSLLTTRVIGLPVEVSSLPYEVRGSVLVSSCALDLAGDAGDPYFTSNSFGTFNFDTRSTTVAVFSDLAALKNKQMRVDSWDWKYLDPSFSSRVISLPRIQDVVTNPSLTLSEGTDFYLEDSTVFFQEPPPEGLWAEYVGFDESYIKDNFGANVGLTDDSSDLYKARVRGLYYAYWQGPTVAAIRQGIHILVGLPIAEKAGTVESINTSFSGVLGVITVSGVDYLYPLLAGTSLVVGQEVRTFEPLCDGVEVVDYRLDPEWFVNLSINEMRKFHTFAVYLNLDAFNLETFSFASSFVDNIKPTWKEPVFVVFKALTDTVSLGDDISLRVVLKLYDQPCDYPIIVYDGVEYEGEEADWKYDQSLVAWESTSAVMRGTAATLTGVATLTNGSASATGSGTAWVSEIGSGVLTTSYVAAALYTSGTGMETSASSNDIYHPAGSFGPVEVGDMIDIAGEGVFEVVTVQDAYNISVDGPMSASNTNVSWANTGKLKVWGRVIFVGSATTLTFSSAFTGTSGKYILALLNNDYREAFYDAFTESCPDEQFTINIKYTGLTPPVGPVTVPAPSGTTTHTFTSTGEVYSVTLSELVP